jgi:hypothetical protein
MESYALLEKNRGAGWKGHGMPCPFQPMTLRTGPGTPKGGGWAEGRH